MSSRPSSPAIRRSASYAFGHDNISVGAHNEPADRDANGRSIRFAKVQTPDALSAERSTIVESRRSFQTTDSSRAVESLTKPAEPGVLDQVRESVADMDSSKLHEAADRLLLPHSLSALAGTKPSTSDVKLLYKLMDVDGERAAKIAHLIAGFDLSHDTSRDRTQTIGEAMSRAIGSPFLSLRTRRDIARTALLASHELAERYANAGPLMDESLSIAEAAKDDSHGDYVELQAARAHFVATNRVADSGTVDLALKDLLNNRKFNEADQTRILNSLTAGINFYKNSPDSAKNIQDKVAEIIVSGLRTADTSQHALRLIACLAHPTGFSPEHFGTVIDWASKTLRSPNNYAPSEERTKIVGLLARHAAAPSSSAPPLRMYEDFATQDLLFAHEKNVFVDEFMSAELASARTMTHNPRSFQDLAPLKRLFIDLDLSDTNRRTLAEKFVESLALRIDRLGEDSNEIEAALTLARAVIDSPNFAPEAAKAFEDSNALRIENRCAYADQFAFLKNSRRMDQTIDHQSPTRPASISAPAPFGDRRQPVPNARAESSGSFQSKSVIMGQGLLSQKLASSNSKQALLQSEHSSGLSDSGSTGTAENAGDSDLISRSAAENYMQRKLSEISLADLRNIPARGASTSALMPETAAGQLPKWTAPLQGVSPMGMSPNESSLTGSSPLGVIGAFELGETGHTPMQDATTHSFEMKHPLHKVVPMYGFAPSPNPESPAAATSLRDGSPSATLLEGKRNGKMDNAPPTPRLTPTPEAHSQTAPTKKVVRNVHPAISVSRHPQLGPSPLAVVLATAGLGTSAAGFAAMIAQTEISMHHRY